MRTKLLMGLVALLPVCAFAQQTGRPRLTDSARAAQRAAALKKYDEKKFTHADSLRGNLGPERTWWDVQRYDITIKPDFKTKYTSGKDLITYKVVKGQHPSMMQIDLK